MVTERQRIKTRKDGQIGFVGGADSLTHPLLVSPNRVSFAGNVSFRGGFCDQRPGFIQRVLSFDRDSYYDWFKSGVVQGWGVYRNGRKREAIVSVSGRIFSCDLETYAVSERTPTNNNNAFSLESIPPIGGQINLTLNNVFGIEVGHPIYASTYEYKVLGISGSSITVKNIDDTRTGAEFGSQVVTHLLPNASYTGEAWMIQADRYFVIQDGISSAIIFDGPINRRASATQGEVPPGRQMAYGLGRLWVAVNDNEVVAGDLLGSTTGILKFTENTYLNEGGKFKIPDDNGPIRALKFISTLDTSLGQGPLLVATTGAIFSLNAPTDRDTWRNLTDPIQTYSLLTYGVVSQDSVVLVNGDMFYRSIDGIRSFIMARRDFGTWGNVPVSTEMDRVLRNDDELLIKYTSAILFDNRFLFTVNPQLFKYRAYFRGIGSLDFAPISSMGQKGPPAYDMTWSGIRPFGLFTASIGDDDRAYAWAISSTGETELWQIMKRKDFDNDDDRITSFIESRAYAFNSPFELKRLIRGELFIDQVKGTVDFTVYWKPDGYECWLLWGTYQACQTYRQCSTDVLVCNTINDYKPGYRNRIKLSEPPNTEINSPNNPGRDFYTTQVRIEWTGCARLLKFLLVAEQPIEDAGYPDDE